MLPTQRVSIDENAQTPSYRNDEHGLGYETALIFIDGGHGLPLDKITMAPIPNSRKTNPYINQFIKTKWEEEQKDHKAYDSPRARYEGSLFNNDTNQLAVLWSEERYSTHAAIRNAKIGKAYQANLWTINAVLFPRNRKLPIGLRNPVQTDQGQIKHLTPVGFVDLKPRKIYDEKGNLIREGMDVESVGDAVSRILYSEWEVPIGAFDSTKMELLGIVYNYYKNFDYTASVLVPLNCDSSELKSKKMRDGTKGKYDAIEEVDMNESSLRSLLFGFAFAPDKSSGHMRGDIALTIGRLYGGRQKYLEVLEDTLMELNKLK